MLTVCIRIVADCGLHPCQAAQKLERAATLEFTAGPAIIFIHCWQLAFFIHILFHNADMF